MSTAPPTTLAPTTLAPTTLATTLAPTTTATTAAPTTTATTAAPTTTLTTVVPTTAAPPYRDPTKDSYVSVPPIRLKIEVRGRLLNKYFDKGPISLKIAVRGRPIFGLVFDAGRIGVRLPVRTIGHTFPGRRGNVVQWSRIGHFNFEIDESNEAGDRALDWKGNIYHLRKLVDRIMAYGQNGVTILRPVGVAVGMQTLYTVGLKNKGAFCGTDSEHFFVDNQNQLFRVADQLERLGYDEYISNLSYVMMSMDANTGLVYICDGTTGYVYGSRDGSFGKGPPNVSGLGVQGGTMYVVAPAEITTPIFNKCTDIYDLGTRKPKTIHSLDISANTTGKLYAAIDFRLSEHEAFRTTGWFLVNPNGTAYPICHCVEFRVRLKALEYEVFSLSKIRVRGVINNFVYGDQVI